MFRKTLLILAALAMIAIPLTASAAVDTSGTTAVATSGDTAVSAITVTVNVRNITVVNTGAAAGFFSTDGGTTWVYLPATSSVTLNGSFDSPVVTGTVKVKRIAGGTDLSGVFVTIW